MDSLLERYLKEKNILYKRYKRKYTMDLLTQTIIEYEVVDHISSRRIFKIILNKRTNKTKIMEVSYVW